MNKVAITFRAAKRAQKEKANRMAVSYVSRTTARVSGGRRCLISIIERRAISMIYDMIGTKRKFS
jgi:DNA repair exonuclease SbcCD ATPase subunit